MDDLGFRYQLRKNGEVIITHRGKRATVLRGEEAAAFVADADGADASELQQEMARLTGNYRRGNERQAREHPRNR
jgi:hypothetical protein|tara:strand:+ start:28387 stop:28611 length:225 start_codon:yes stop_codon:yes gene_type:complete